MRNRAVRTLSFAVATVVLFTAAACGGGDSSPPAGAKSDTAAPGAPNAAGTPASAAKATATKAEATLRPAGGSAANGTATLTQAADKVEYRVEVSGASPGPHAMYLIQNATCASGNRTGPLSPLDASADGNGIAEGTMTTQLGSLIGRSLAIYAGDKGDSEVIACGSISAAQ